MATPAREVLVATAQRLYAEKGVAATTPREVLATSGIGQGSLYHHFPSKRDLAVAAVSRTVEETLRSALSELKGTRAPAARLAAYLERPRDAVAGCRVGRLTADPVVMADPDLHIEVATYFRDLIDAVAGVLSDQGLEADAAHDRATTAVAVIQGGYVLSRALDDQEPMRAAVRGFLGLLEVRR